ncbi:MAG: N-acetylgalactosamine-6-sulfatase [Flavobacteriaceae bacterium]|nr:N-acetylgalactosamine-6-sulfatase [Flavobacteriaceae bacterium]
MEKKLIIIVTLLFFLVSCLETKKTIDSPNFVFILADDLGYGELGVFGQNIIETPNIDKLAKEGMILTDHYSGSPVCAPARAVLMTGLHTGNSPVRGNDEWKERGDVWSFEAMFKNPELEGQRPLPDSIKTVATYLQSNHYKTGMVGKWGLGAPNTNSIPNNKGFDFFYGYNCQRQAHTLYPSHLWKNKDREILKNKIVDKGALKTGADPNDSKNYEVYNQNDYAPTLMHNEALSFIDRNKDNKFFLYYASPLPHLPLQTPKKWVNYYRKKIGDEKPYIGGKGYYPNQFPKATYAAMISYLDEQVGEIVAKLKKIGKYENTLIIFTSDNGPTHLNQVDIHFFNSAGIFVNSKKTVKGSINEGGIRVPTIATWPKRIKSGTTSNHPSTFYDFFATVSDIIGKPSSYKNDGISYYPTLVGKKQKKHDYLYWEFPAYGGQQAIRINKWKGIKKNLLKGPSKLQLYNLNDDPKEINNLADSYPQIVKKMEISMEKAHTKAKIKKFNIPVLDEK